MGKIVKITIFVSLLSLPAGPGFSQTSKSAPIVAVFDIENRGSPLTDTEIRGLTDYLSTKLSEGGSIFVIPRDEIRKRITKQKLESKKECFDSSCQIAIGKELAAEYSITSSISRIGDNCIVASKLFELTKATSVDAASARKACNPNELIEGIEEIAAKFIQSVGMRRTNTKTTTHDNKTGIIPSARKIVRHPIDSIVKTTAELTKHASPSSGISVKENPYSAGDDVYSSPEPRTGWSLGAGIAGLVFAGTSAGLGFYGIFTEQLDLTLPLSITAGSMQTIGVPIIKIGSKSAKGHNVWGSTGVEVTAWVTYGFATAFWLLAAAVGKSGGIEYNKAGDDWSNGLVLLYFANILGTVSVTMISIDSLVAYSQANSLISKQSSKHHLRGKTTADGLTIAPSISPLPPPPQHPEATGMVFGVQGSF